MHIQEAMKETGLSKKALQYYEDKGLIYVTKDESGYRVYDEACIHKLWEIKVLRKLDFSSAEIEEIIKNKNREAIFQEHFNEIDKRMAQCCIQKNYIQQLYEEMDAASDCMRLKQLDETMQEEFMRNENVYTQIQPNKGMGLALFIFLIWIILMICYFITLQGIMSIIAIGVFILIVSVFHHIFQRRVLQQPKSAFDVLIDNKVLYVHDKMKGRKAS